MPATTDTKKKIFSSLKSIMEKQCPPLLNSKSSSSGYEITGNVRVPYGSKKVMVDGMYFASTALRASSVVFYFFPLYTSPKEFDKLAPNTMMLLKGKTCFHFKKEEDINEKELNALFKKGIQGYRKMGWIK